MRLTIKKVVKPLKNQHTFDEKDEMLKLWEEINSNNPGIVKRAKEFLADKGYDYTKLIVWLEEHEISPVISLKRKRKNKTI